MWWRAVRARRRIAGARPASTASSPAAEKSCRAVLVPRYGGPEVLEVKQGVPVPDLKPREVLVRTRAVSINPLDLRVSAPFWTYAPSLHCIYRKRLMKILCMLGVQLGLGAAKLESWISLQWFLIIYCDFTLLDILNFVLRKEHAFATKAKGGVS